MSATVSIDLETSSTCDLRKWGSLAYANDASTTVLMFCAAIGMFVF